MEQLWKVALGIAGLGAVASFVVWSIYRQWLSLPIFQQMTKDHQFKLFRLVIVLTFLFGIAGLVAYAIVSKSSAATTSRKIESSRDELIAILQTREANFLQAVTNLYVTLESNGDKEAIDEVRTLKEAVVAINKKRVKALGQGNLVLAHELANELKQFAQQYVERAKDADKKRAEYQQLAAIMSGLSREGMMHARYNERRESMRRDTFYTISKLVNSVANEDGDVLNERE
jgi:hypothetical protein